MNWHQSHFIPNSTFRIPHSPTPASMSCAASYVTARCRYAPSINDAPLRRFDAGTLSRAQLEHGTLESEHSATRLRFHGIIDRRHPGAGPVFAPTVHGSAWPAACSIKHRGQPLPNAKQFVALKCYAGTQSRVSPPLNTSHFGNIATAALGSTVFNVLNQSKRPDPLF